MTYARALVIGGWVCAGVAVILTAGRLAIRWVKLRRLMWDDATHCLALAMLLGWAVVDTYYAGLLTRLIEVQQGKQKFTASFFTDDVPTFLKVTYSFAMLFYAIIWLIKFTFLIFYKGFFRNLRHFTIAWWIVFVYVTITYLGVWVCQMTIGGTPKGVLTISGITSNAATKRIIITVWVITVMDFTTDLCILILPLGLLTKMKIHWRQKIGLSLCFCFALITMAFSLVRGVLYYKSQAVNKAYGSVQNGNIDVAYLYLWAFMEASVAIIVSCLPTYRLILNGSGHRPRQEKVTSESFDNDGLAKIKKPKRNVMRENLASIRRPWFGFSGGDGSHTTSSFKQWLLRLTPSRGSSRRETPQSSFTRFVWRGRGRLGNKGSLHGPLDSVAIPGGTLASRGDIEKDGVGKYDEGTDSDGKSKGGLSRLSEGNERDMV
ncbi:MAG: hypothetical protein M1814_005900 [Vezdaea aestivalis]|nr:MAG: hypothetical protein M1814_005900 [Vezdaea aestivalis]